MKTAKMVFRFLAFLMPVFFMSCASTKFMAVWQDETYTGSPAKIMVIGISNNSAVRRLLEDEFVKELREHETDAVASYTVLPDQSAADRNAVDAKAREIGADTVLITKSVGRKMETTETVWAVYEDTYIDTQTNIYDVKSGRMIWTAAAQTWVREGVADKIRIRLFVKAIAKRLTRQKLLKPAATGADKTGEEKRVTRRDEAVHGLMIVSLLAPVSAGRRTNA